MHMPSIRPRLIACGCMSQALFSRCLQEAAELVEEMREQEEDNSRPVTRGGQGRWVAVMPGQSPGKGVLWITEAGGPTAPPHI